MYCLLFQEKRKNTEEFPSDFPQGAGEGTWWAFVTMSTVGYVTMTTVYFSVSVNQCFSLIEHIRLDIQGAPTSRMYPITGP